MVCQTYCDVQGSGTKDGDEAFLTPEVRELSVFLGKL